MKCPYIEIELEIGALVFEEGGKSENPEKNPWSKERTKIQNKLLYVQVVPLPNPLSTKTERKKNTKKAGVCSMTKCADVIVHDVKDILYLQPLHQKLFCTISTV